MEIRKGNMAIGIICVFLFLFGITAMGQDVTVEEQVLFDEQGVRISVTDMAFTDSSYDITFLLENKTDHDLMFSTTTVSVNGMMIDAVHSKFSDVTVPAGSSEDAVVSFMDIEMSIFGIEEPITEVAINCSVHSDDNNVPDIVTGQLEAHTSAFGSKTQEHDESNPLIDKDGIQIFEQDLTTNDFGVIQYVLVKNGTDKRIHVYAKNQSLNGYTTKWTPDYDVVEPGRYSKVGISFSKGEADEAGGSVKTISSDFIFKDEDTGETLFEETVSIGNESGSGTVLLSAPEIDTDNVYADDVVEVTFGSIEVDEISGLSIPVVFKSRNGKDLSYTLSEVRVNGVKVFGTSGKSSFGNDFMEDVPAGDSFETNIWIDRDDLRRSGITSVSSIDLDLSFLYQPLTMHDITVSVPFSDSSENEISRTAEISNKADDYIDETFQLHSGDTWALLYQMVNPNDAVVSLEGTIDFKDENGNVIERKTDSIAYISPGSFNFLIFTTKNPDASKASLHVSPSVFSGEKGTIEKTVDEIDDHTLKISVKNTGEKTVDAVIKIVVVRDGVVSAMKRGFDDSNSTIRPGETKTCTMENIKYEKHYDYITAVCQ